MSDNPARPSPARFALDDHHVVALAGRDALAFAQAQTMNDAAALADGHWQWNGWLTPKGRVIALFALLRLDAETFWLLLPDADAHALADALRRYVFRSKVAISVLEDQHVSGAFVAPDGAVGARASGDRAKGFELDFGGDGGPRTMRISAGAGEATDAVALQRWARFDQAHGLARLRPPQVEAWTPQQLSLDRLGAYSVKKGCYPGQEIVARTHFLGQAKRALGLYDTIGDAPADADVSDAEGRAVGTVVSTAGSYALAVVPLDRIDDTTLTAATSPLTPRPLQAGLGR